MQQEFKSTEFIITELIYRAFEIISQRESFLLHFSDLSYQSMLTFYMNDFFDDFRNFQKQYDFLKNHFLLRVEWARLRLSFKKLKLFEEFIKALDVTYIVKEHVKILKERVAKIVKWSVS